MAPRADEDGIGRENTPMLARVSGLEGSYEAEYLGEPEDIREGAEV